MIIFKDYDNLIKLQMTMVTLVRLVQSENAYSPEGNCIYNKTILCGRKKKHKINHSISWFLIHFHSISRAETQQCQTQFLTQIRQFRAF